MEIERISINELISDPANARKHGERNIQIVLDSFLGSGSTLIDAEQVGRRCFGFELSPAYCDVIVKRWETLTGKKAILDDTRHEDDSASVGATVADQAGVPRRIGRKTDKDNRRPAKQTA